jgi:hypothetical protein
MTPADVLASTKLRLVAGAPAVLFHCPGCDMTHQVQFAGATHWVMDGTPDHPTFWPSIKVTRPTMLADEICHSFITEGMITFLDDCTHALKGQKIPMPTWPHARSEYGGIIEPIQANGKS